MSQPSPGDPLHISPIASLDFKHGMRRLASGVVIIAVDDEGEKYGLAVTAVSSISADPPILMVCVNQKASAHDALVRAGCFTVNLLSQADREVADLFGSPSHRHLRFSTGRWNTLTTGAPVLSGSLATFDCRTVNTMPASSHTIFFGKVVGLALSSNEIDPLLYWDGAYRSNVLEDQQ